MWWSIYLASFVASSSVQSELNQLLHVAIAHSNLTRLSELAQAGESIVGSLDIGNPIEDGNRLFKDTVQFTITDRVWELESDFLDGLQFISDFGDHLVDKLALIHQWGGLESLLDWVVEDGSGNEVQKRAVELLTELTQNRDEAVELIYQARPGMIRDIVKRMDGCFIVGKGSMRGLCGSWVSLVTALVSRSTDVKEFEKLGSHFSRMSQPDSVMFPRYVTLFRAFAIAQGDAWRDSVDILRLKQWVGHHTLPLHVGHRLYMLLQSELTKSDSDAARGRLYHQCVEKNGHEDDWCDQFMLDRDEL
jgi:hypothetical protein